MRQEVRKDLSASACDFERVVRPILQEWFKGELFSVETVSPDFKNELDMLAGIDAWHFRRGKTGMRGVANRIQWVKNGKGFNTFTIRYTRPNGSKTEFEKRKIAIQNLGSGWMYPHLTVQSYVREPRGQGDLVSMAAVKTLDLFKVALDFVDDRSRFEGANIGFRKAGNGGEQFIYIGWSHLVTIGAYIKIFGGKPCHKPS